MAFKSTLESEYRLAVDRAATIKRQAQQLHDQTAASDVSSSVILDFHGALVDALVIWSRVRAMSGIGAYAQARHGAGYDVGVEFAAMETQAALTRDWIETTIPKDGLGGWLNTQRWDAQHAIEVRSFTTVQTAGLRVELLALIATID